MSEQKEPHGVYVPTLPGMRAMLLVASLLVFLVGVSLFLLTDQTDRYFAWTIANPLTAAFLGAGYWASGLMELLAGRERRWREARIAVPAVLVFTVMTLVLTLAYRDVFHFDAPDLITRVGTWFWLGVYAFVPLIMGALFLRQGWSTGLSRDDDEPLPGWIRALFLVQAVIMAGFGLWLVITPLEVTVWPWELTELTGRAIGVWLVSLSVAAVQVAWENGKRRTRAATASYLLLALLQLLALARYPDEVDFGSIQAWLYVLFLTSMALGGLYLLLGSRGILRPDQDARPAR